MQHLKIVLSLAISVIGLAGCQSTKQSIEQRINIETYTDHDYHSSINTVSAKETIALLNDVEWQSARIGKARPADYKVQFSNSLTDAKTPVYEIWLSPHKDRLEIIVPTTNRYAQLDRQTSQALFKMLTQRDLASIQ